MRKGKRIASVAATPRNVRVLRTKDPIIVKCALAGYYPGSEVLKSGYSKMSKNNIYAGGLIGMTINSATGADNEYSHGISVWLEPLPGTVRPRY